MASTTNICMRIYGKGQIFNIYHFTAPKYFHSFIHQLLYSPFLGPGLFFSSMIFFTLTVGLLGRLISPSQGRYLHTGQHKRRINARPNIHTLSGNRNHDPRFRTSEESSCLKPRDRCDRTLCIPSLVGPYIHANIKIPHLHSVYFCIEPPIRIFHWCLIKKRL
jgi:hypothetical protein